MKKLSKSLVLSVAVATALASNAVAEESAGFIGVEVGASASKQEAKLTLSAPALGSQTFSEKLEPYGFNVGIIGGYKAFFTSWFGLRAYANLNYIHTLSNEEVGKDTQTIGGTTTERTIFQDYTIAALNYGVNLDLLFNVAAFEEANLGLFAGVGIGANTFMTSNSIDAAKKRFENANNAGGTNLSEGLSSIKDKTYTGFDAWVNVGIRTNFLTNHELEVLAKVPFVGTTAYNKTLDFGGVASANANVKFYIPWNVNVRYIYSF